jgi:SAM-dependent methyltransferase
VPEPRPVPEPRVGGEQIDTTFSKLAPDYVRYGELLAPRLRPFLATALTVNPAGQARIGLDLGCGSGRFTPLLAAHCQRVVAVDGSAEQVAFARSRVRAGNVEYRPADMMSLDPEEQHFDVVMSVNTLFHLYTNQTPSRVLAHVADLVAPGGLLLLIDVVATPTRLALRQRLRGVRDAGRVLDRRSASDLLFMLRFRQSRAWMSHVRTHQPLSPARFAEECRRQFGDRGAYTWPIGRERYAAGFVWRRPAP